LWAWLQNSFNRSVDTDCIKASLRNEYNGAWSGAERAHYSQTLMRLCSVVCSCTSGDLFPLNSKAKIARACTRLVLLQTNFVFFFSVRFGICRPRFPLPTVTRVHARNLSAGGSGGGTSENLLAQHNNIINARAMSPNRSLSMIINVV